jgi:hypothetical protein
MIRILIVRELTEKTLVNDHPFKKAREVTLDPLNLSSAFVVNNPVINSASVLERKWQQVSQCL